ncbi:MAG TPA: energy transducer TonB [Pyrinomonadaceae bacterium]|nr:energy transducer TonB [Pyrinomonadaceae bacterium]
MRSRLLHCTLLVIAAAATVAAQSYVHTWLRVAPEGEEFAVHFPEPNFRIRRELPFGGGVTLRPASYEITNRGSYFYALSFSKSEPGAPKSLDAFVEGFRKALSEGAGAGKASLEFEHELPLEGRAGRQFALSVGDAQGSARVYETEQHFYALLTYGRTIASGAEEHFLDSFTFNRNGADRVELSDTASVLTVSARPPESLSWPVAGGANLVVETRGDKSQPGGLSDTDASKAGGRKVVSGGVLNGKAIAKPQPAYPPIAKAARVQGTVTVQVLVDEEGYVIAANAVSGHPLLQPASVFAARQARFSPTLLEGQPVKVSGVITYNFVLQ